MAETLQVDLPPRVAQELEALVHDGWFVDEAEAVRLAVLEFVRRHQFELHERFQREDIAWALQQAPAKP